MNIYIKAMEIGYRENNGITYIKLKGEIQKKLNIKLEGDLEYVFIEWILLNFRYPDISNNNNASLLRHIRKYLNGDSGKVEENSASYTQFARKLFYLKGQTVKQYLDYLELKESRLQAKRAFLFSIGSIILAIGSIFLTWYLSTKEYKPPYDVKIIENKVTHDKLKNTIDSLTNELDKAVNLINIYEEDNLK